MCTKTTTSWLVNKLLVYLASFIFYLNVYTSNSIQASAQSRAEVGDPLVTSWLPNEYGASPQVWSIARDHRGVMYFGTDQGILEYDGVSWRLIQTESKERCASLIQGPDERIYAGCIADFGYLAPDSLGQMQLFSLLPHVPEDKKDFTDIWILKKSDHSVYFSTRYIFHWTPTNTLSSATHATGEMEILEVGNTAAGNALHGGYVADNAFHIRKLNEGMMRLVGDSLTLVPDGARFADDRVYVMLPYDDESRLLVGARNQGLFIYDGETFAPFATEADPLLQVHDLYMPGAVLNDGFLLNTLSGGAMVLDKDGQLVQRLTQQTGLADNTVISVYASPDLPEAQWLALNTGIARVEATGPFTTLGNSRGLTSRVNNVHRHGDQLYVATAVGVFQLDPTSGNLEPVDMPSSQARDFLSVEETLLAATDNGIFTISDNQATYLRKSLDTKVWETFVLHQSKSVTNRVFAGVTYGMAILELNNGRWQDGGHVPGFEDEIISIAETDRGVLWAGTRSNGILRIIFTSDGDNLLEDVQVDRFDQQHGLPEGSISALEASGRLFFMSNEGFFQFDTEANQFSPDTSLAHLASSGKRSVLDAGNGMIWAIGNGIALGSPEPDGSYNWLESPFHRFSETLFSSVYTDDDNITWFGGAEGLLRYDPGVTVNYDAPYPALIRRVISGEDSLVYGGAGAAPVLRFDYGHNDMQFQFASPSFEDVQNLQFQSRLDGYDDHWSNWSARTERAYTNLSEGEYTFRVRAKNGYGTVSQEGFYSFLVSPPWFRTWWAYVGYIGLIGLFLFGADRFQRQRLLAKEHVKAQQREAELRLKNELEIKRIEAESLKELDEMRTTFFSNISHELRTPLTLILGQIESVKSEFNQEKPTQKLDMALRNARRLHQLVNQLLDVAKLEAGKMPLSVSSSDIVSFLRKLFVSFESLAAQKQFGLRFHAAIEELDVYFEPEKMEKIFLNLVSNAIKFTPDGGEVSAHIRQVHLEDRGWAEIEVRDSGIGIPEDQIPFIFDRFYQVDSGKTRDYEGTGIGLALAKELVELHGGTIGVISKEGLGTSFTFRLPLGRDHLTTEQIASHASTNGRSTIIAGLPDPAGVLPEPTNGSEERGMVLIVEDNADMRTYIRETLEQQFDIREAADGRQGFEMAQTLIPDLIVSDVMMPAVDGYELSQNIRKDELTSHIPIVMLTARVAEEARLEGLESGVDAYLTKPFSTRELQVRVRKLIELRQMLREQQEHPFKITSSNVAVTSVDEAFIERLQSIVEANMEDEHFQVESLCKEIGVSERQLYRKLKALLNCTPAAYIRLIRLDRAKQLLEKKAGTVSEITFQVGYSNTSAFARAFREVYGKAPSEVLKGNS